MNELAEIEQADRIKKWCREYGLGIIVGILLAIFVSWSWSYWRQEQENKLLAGSIQYEYLLTAIMRNESTTTLNTLASALLKNYSYSPYASLAALYLAKRAVNQNNLVHAASMLVWVIEHGKDRALQSVARVRLARVLLAQNQAARALNVLAANEDKAYSSITLEEKGDILLHLGYRKEALQNYFAAKRAFSDSIIEQPVLEMKINNLA